MRKGKYSDFRDPEDHVRLIQAQLGKGDTSQAEATIRDLERSMAGLDKTRSCRSPVSDVVMKFISLNVTRPSRVASEQTRRCVKDDNGEVWW